MIYVCSLREMPRYAAALRPSHIVSLIDRDYQPPTPSGVPPARHHRVQVHDISDPVEGMVCPAEADVARLIEFLGQWDGRAPLLVHCYAGISRSMAAALIALVAGAPGREAEAAAAMRRVAPHAQPNRRIVALADTALGCDGRLIAARETMRPARLLTEGPLVRLDRLL
jgi:predicted protein tyrosine phosphatase